MSGEVAKNQSKYGALRHKRQNCVLSDFYNFWYNAIKTTKRSRYGLIRMLIMASQDMAGGKKW